MIDLKTKLRREYGLFRFHAYTDLIREHLKKPFSPIDKVTEKEYINIRNNLIPQMIIMEEIRQKKIKKSRRRKTKIVKDYGILNRQARRIK